MEKNDDDNDDGDDEMLTQRTVLSDGATGSGDLSENHDVCDVEDDDVKGEEESAVNREAEQSVCDERECWSTSDEEPSLSTNKLQKSLPEVEE